MTVFRINSLGMFWNDPPVLTLTHNTQNFFGTVFYLQNESNFEGFCLFVNVPSNVFNHWRPFSLLRRVLRKISWNKFNFQHKNPPKKRQAFFDSWPIKPLSRGTFESHQNIDSGGVESKRIDFEDNEVYCMKVILGERDVKKNVIKWKLLCLYTFFFKLEKKQQGQVLKTFFKLPHW